MSDWSDYASIHHCYEVDASKVRSLVRALEQARQYGGFKSLDALAEGWLPVGEEDADWFQDPDYSYRIHALLERCRIGEDDHGAGDNPLLKFDEEPNLLPDCPAWHTWKAVDLEGAVQVFVAPARSVKPPSVSMAGWVQKVEADLRDGGDKKAKENAVARLRRWKSAANKSRDSYSRRLKKLARKRAWILTWREIKVGDESEPASS